MKERRKRDKADRDSGNGEARKVRFKKTEDPGGEETPAPKARLATKAVTRSSTGESWQFDVSSGQIEEIGADGTAVVGGVAGFYKADGGCDRATCGTKYAKFLEKAGVKTVYYEQPRPAKLADGSVKNVIKGYCIADIELVTKAGTVVLPRSHIDILDGPENANLIYIGEAEEKRLKLRSYAEQLEDLARKCEESSKKDKPKAPDKCSKHCCSTSQLDGGTTVSSETKNEQNHVPFKAARYIKPALADGHACVGEHNWKVLKRTPYT